MSSFVNHPHPFIRLVSADLDGTTLPKGSKAVGPETAHALEEFSQGDFGLVVFNSARSPESQRRVLEDLSSRTSLHPETRPWILSGNGALGFKPNDEKPFFKIPLSQVDSFQRAIVAWFEEHPDIDHLEPALMTVTGWEKVSKVPDPSHNGYQSPEYYCISIRFKEFTDAQAFEQALKSITGLPPFNLRLVHDHHFGYTSMHIVAAEADKGLGLNHIEHDQGINPVNTVHLGDDWNDIDAWKDGRSKGGVVGSDPKILTLADFEIPPPSEEGVAQYLRHLIKMRGNPGG